jgi:uridine phosphorylase
MERIESSELVLTPEGAVYHLNLHPENIGSTILLVGDPGRVPEVSKHFDNIDFKTQSREFITHTGSIGGKRLSVISSGIGTDNCDIVVNELDALVNIDLQKRTVKEQHTSLDIIRIGTSGALHATIEPDTYVVSKFAMGIDGMANFYDFTLSDEEEALAEYFASTLDWGSELAYPFAFKGSERLTNLLAPGNNAGITVTANGFYGPQGRRLRAPLRYPDINTKFETFDYNGMKLCNYEMETSGIYALAGMLGHNAATICLIVANRVTKRFSTQYKPKMEGLIEEVIGRVMAE